MVQHIRMRHADRLPHIGERHRGRPTIEEQTARRHQPLLADLGARTLAPFLVRPRLLVHDYSLAAPRPAMAFARKPYPKAAHCHPHRPRLSFCETLYINIDVNVT